MIPDSPNYDDSDESDFLSIAGEDVDTNVNHYRVPKSSNYGPLGSDHPPRNRRANRDQVKFSNEGKIMTLTELAAQKVACHLPFGLVEHFNPPVPEPMQCRIAYWSFPQDEEDVKLYTCLANGNADVFCRAEELVCQNAVRDMLQVGFHLSANVQFLSESQDLELFRVAITFDRRRITSCCCSCMTSTFWCEHVVAVCLQRIRAPQEVKLRAPVSESLQRLEKNQLQKFAQYLINELPQQILPAAQKLLDELLSGDEAVINQNPAAPDPTAGATIHEQTNWCLDYTHLSKDIHRILDKQCTSQPTVCSDIQSLHDTAPPATTEYTQLLRPIRGREPEGIWNLISIVGEMMRRRDPNLFSLLDIMTEEVLKSDKIITWWFETKVSLHSGSTIRFASTKNSQSTSQYSCSNFCDEIVHLWRLAALNPSASPIERQRLARKFFDWHLAILRRHSSLADNGTTSSIKATKRNCLELFPGFKFALEGCQIDWSDWDEKKSRLTTFDEREDPEKQKPVKTKKKRKRSRSARHNSGNDSKVGASNNEIDTVSQNKQTTDDKQETVDDISSSQTIDGPDLDHDEDKENRVNVNIDSNDHYGASTSKDEQPRELSHEKESHDDLNNADDGARIYQALDVVEELDEEEDAAEQNGPAIEQDLQVYFMDGQVDNSQIDQKPESLEDLIKINIKRLADPLEILYAKMEGLHAHGYLDESRRVAQRVANEILCQRNYPNLRQLFILPRKRKKKGTLDNQMSIVISETLSRINFICNVLIDYPEDHNLIFKLIMFGVELKRSPAATKPLEVKLISQKQDLVLLLKNIVLRESELDILREKALTIHDESEETPPDALTSLILGNYIFEALVLSRFPKLPTDANLGFQTALSALGTKISVSEVDHPLLCEGIRRQRGELALTLITHYKDDQERLDSIMKQLLDKDLLADARQRCEKPPTSISNKKAPFGQDPNQPTEAAAHFMFELAKTVFDKAGGNSTTAHYFRPQLVAQNNGRGIHRKLHMCTLRIAHYALGLQNRTSPNWMLRTYNGRAHFIQERSLDIGLPAIKFLCENWEGFLTPVETSVVADKASRSNDPEMKRFAAELAKSCLKYVNLLDHNIVGRILAQCREQTIGMFEAACSEIEQIAENDNPCADVLFLTARAWHGLYETLNERQSINENSYQLTNSIESESSPNDWLASSGQQQQHHHHQHHQQRDRRQPPAPQFNEARQPLVGDVYLRNNNSMIQPDEPTGPNYKNLEYIRAAFRLGLKALDSMKLSLHLGGKHNPKKLEEILWLLGIIIKYLGRDCLYKFSRSVIKNITDPWVLHKIIIDVIRFFEDIKLPKDHTDRVNILMPLYDKCLDRCLKQTRDLMKRKSYDQTSCIETILKIVQTLTSVIYPILTTQYYWEILEFLEKKKNNFRVQINIDEHRLWVKKFTSEGLMLCDCDDCFVTRSASSSHRFKTLH